ncbi:hypothetical protein H0H92_009475 [Tricholoma furcatifolium]|nr:hypothetical protein H0H92_009475 [Tricholoma furcatifolium]
MLKKRNHPFEHNMANPHLHPLEINSKTGEPFLRLRKHKDIIITPPRPEDVAHYELCLNDPLIYKWLANPPFPFLAEHAESMYQKFKVVSERANETLEVAVRGCDSRTRVLFEDCPVRTIRQVNDDGTDIFLGDIGFSRAKDGKMLAPLDEVNDEEKVAQYRTRNVSLSLGDPNIAWSIGCFLASSHHGRGIMTDAVQTLIWDWAVPRMDARLIVIGAFEGNQGSVRTFEKSGFVHKGFIENYVQARGQWRNLHLLEWNISSSLKSV